jgi:ubiquinone/menaquinone biosynthesis C-methylase UbiE
MNEMDAAYNTIAGFFIRRLQGFIHDLDLQDKSVLDIGCWWGWFIKYAREKGAKSYGFDFEPGNLRNAVELLRSNSGLLVANGEEIPFKNDHFEFVFSNHVLEHVPNDDAMIKEIHRILKTDGNLILAVPNDLGFSTIIYRMFRWFLTHKSDFLKRHRRYLWLKSITYNDPSHYREYTGKKLQELLESNDFKIIKIKSFGLDMPYPLKGRISKLARLKISHLLGPITPPVLREEIILHAVKK